MCDMSVGAFLALKMTAFADFVGYPRTFSTIEATIVAQEIYDRKRVEVSMEDWDGLLDGVPEWMIDAVQATKADSSKHARFWLYMQLFVETISHVQLGSEE